MASEKVETVIAGNYLEMEREGEECNSTNSVRNKLSNFFWHGGSVYDAWFSCSSNQVAQVLLTLPYSFSQLGMLSQKKKERKVDFRNHVIQWFEKFLMDY
ncbi:hypothetical protein HAX54_022922 [Datura stramonium]|uniref:Uncharacterized protein n=1 Tax=Datura stramonium TaxID=4076 RepID=A0ABS8UVE0_DATST|nr:hypothetical protein [Datura stramonium]